MSCLVAAGNTVQLTSLREGSHRWYWLEQTVKERHRVDRTQKCCFIKTVDLIWLVSDSLTTRRSF